MKTKFITATCFAPHLFASSKNTGNNATVDCGGTAKPYTTEVRPVIQSTCATGSRNGPGAQATYQQAYNMSRAVMHSIKDATIKV